MKKFTTASALALVISGVPAVADVTPQQVWDDLETYMEKFGYQVEATEAMAGDTLTVTDITMSFDIPEEDGSFAFTMDQMTLTDQGDGTVLLGFAEELPLVMKGLQDGQSIMDMTMMLGQQGLKMVVSGEPNNLTYDYTADEMSVRVSEITVDGESMSGEDMKIDVAMKGLAGKSVVVRADGLQKVDQDQTAEVLEFDIAFQDPDSGDNVTFAGNYSGIKSTGNTAVPLDLDLSDPSQLMTSGLAGGAKMSHSGGQANFKVMGSDNVDVAMSSTSGSLDVSLSEDGIAYDVAGTGSQATVSGPMPFPLSLAMEKSGFSLMIPTKPNDGPKDAKLSFEMAGFTMDDMLWMMFDGGNVLPRDPATIALDLQAKVTPFLNIFDPKDAEKLESGDVMPGELNEVTLSNLLIEAIGGKIMGTGAFVFDNTDLTSFDGMPRPEGQLNLRAEGINGVLDKLVEMGLLSSSDVGGARMMMAMFTEKGETADSMSSVIEINAEGHILANGQRIQ
jgi:hypothetical protein